MSIPKEPRQLMITIMYLVLTAMLALNVSAEIINAFFMIDRGIEGSNQVLDQSNDFALEALVKNAEQDPEKYRPLVEAAKEVQTISREFTSYVGELREEVVEATNQGYYPEDDPKHPGQPKGYKNKDVTTRLLVEEGKGAELKERILETRQKLISVLQGLKDVEGSGIDDEAIAEVEKNITLEIDDAWQAANKPISWSHFTFNQMPVASIFPIMRKFQNDMKSSEGAILNYLVNSAGLETFKVDAFQPIASARKAYVIAGEPYEAEISVGAISKSVAENTVIKVNGSTLPVEDGVAKFSTTTSSTGPKEYKVDVTLTNPTTGKTETYSKTFEYEVGQRSVAVAADKMNVFYIGVPNPITVSAAGTPTSSLRVSGSNVNLAKKNGSQYTATVSSPGEATITVSGEGLKATRFPFRVKRIPDPEARLSNKDGGEMGTGEFKAQGGVGAFLDDFDFDATCQVVGFNLAYAPARADVILSNNNGARYTDKTRRLVNQAKPGDRYFFENVRAKCPGDNASRKINDMVFKIR